MTTVLTKPRMSTPTTTTTTTTAPKNTPASDARRSELRELGRQISEIQAQLGFSDAELLRRYENLGSSRTYGRVSKNDLQGISDARINSWIGRFASVLENLRLELSSAKLGGAEEALLDNLPHAVAVREAITAMLTQPADSIQRVTIIMGGTGSGKTSALRLAQAKLGGVGVIVEARETWSSKTAALRAIAVAIGATTNTQKIPTQAALLLDMITDRLRDQRTILFIDEGHHMTGQVLNLLKSIVNETRAFIVIAAMDTLWEKLSSNSWQESKQITLNRAKSKLKLPAPSSSAIKQFLKARNQLAAADIQPKQLKALVQRAESLGNWAFIRRVSEHLREVGDLDQAIMESVAEIGG